MHDPSVIPLEVNAHGKNEPIHTTVNPYGFPIDVPVMRAFDEISGTARPNDPWNGNHMGFYRSLFTVDRTGMPKRSCAANGYLEPTLNRPNLKILTETTALHIILDGSLVAKGIELQHGGSTHKVLAKKEVILSSGVINTPQLLELSGIGDPEVLNDVGIECRLPLPGVGNNLQEHPLSSMIYELADGETSFDSLLKDPAMLQEHQQLLIEHRGGAFSGFMSIVGCVPYASLVTKDELEQTVSKVRTFNVEPVKVRSFRVY